ncbi:helix-turn-helix domain-containing protein [Streptomyces sp. cmx-4-9]|uniref:helix-turn-helix domain-containing protein n=1 Tax=Streptomyces sp. cmx-4-9 TaxID=2790941 RepID=UPI0039809C4F
MNHPPTTYEVDGTAICTKRMEAGKSVSALALQVGCTPNYLRKIERGVRRHMSPGFYVRLRDALQSADDDLLA